MTLAIIAGSGALPVFLHGSFPKAVFVTLEGTGVTPPAGANHLPASFEKIGALFSDMRAAGVRDLVFAGSMPRPSLNPARFDMKMLSLVPRVMPAMGKGDDTLLRLVIEIFEGEGFTVKGAHQLLPDLTVPAGHIAGPKPSRALRADAARAAAIHAHISALDIGQAVAVSGGLCLGIETIQGTDALLSYIATSRAASARPTGGVLAKLPKAGQDLRIDMPAIGPGTVAAASSARLEGIVIAPGRVLLLERARLASACDRLGISLWAEELA